MKVILTGGGTGGHIYPAIAIADQIKAQHPDAEILFVGTQKGMEKDLVHCPQYIFIRSEILLQKDLALPGVLQQGIILIMV